jgi:hypothetical protein
MEAYYIIQSLDFVSGEWCVTAGVGHACHRDGSAKTWLRKIIKKIASVLTVYAAVCCKFYTV